MAQQVAIRLGTTGKAEVKSDYAEIKAAGTQAMTAIADGARRAGDAGEQQARRLTGAFDRATADLEAAEIRRRRAAEKLATIQPQTAIQMRINDAVGTGFPEFEGSAKRSAIAIGELIAQEEKLEQRTRALMAAIDPVGAAQDRFNAEILEAKTLLDAGRISTDQYAAAETRAKGALDQVTAAQLRNNQASGAHRMGMQQLGFQLNDIATMYALGARPAQIFASQVGQVTQAVSMMTNGTSKLAGFLGGPWGIAITIGVIALSPLISKLWEGEGAMKAVELAADNMGKAQSTLGEMFDLTTGKIKNQNDMLRLNAQLLAINLRAEAAQKETSSRGVFESAASGKSPLLDQIIATATFRGKGYSRDVSNRAQTLQGWVAQMRQGTLSHEDFAKLAESFDFSHLGTNREELLQALADDLTVKRNRELADKIEGSVDSGRLDPEFRKPGKKPPKPKVDRHAETLARESTATESLIANLGKLADAYEESDAAALKAKIVAEATEKGIKKQADVTAYVAQQVRKTVAERTAGAAEAAAALRTETDARTILNNQVEQGLITAEQAQTILRDEAQIRPFIIAQALAEGEAKEKLAGKIAFLRNEQKRSNEETIRERALRMIADQSDALAIAKREGELIYANDNEHERSLSTLRLQLDLNRAGIEAESELGRQILDNHQKIIDRNQATARMVDDWHEAQRIGENFIDTVLDVSSWNDWGDVGRRVINDLMNDMIRLATINPIKNLLFGSSLPTIGGVFNAFKGGFNASALAADANSVINAGIGRNAAGTERWSGGMTWIAENGPEIVNLPEGTKITPAHRTRRLLANDNPSVNVPFSIEINAPGADAEQLGRLTLQVQEMQRTFSGKVVETVNDAMSRRMIR